MNSLAKWTLMHKKIEVANVEMIEEGGLVSNVLEVFQITHAPVGTVWANTIDRKSLNEWLQRRVIPASRHNIDVILRELEIINPAALSLKSYGLSLSDHYWFKPTEKKISWDLINFFDNEFSDDMGELLFENKSFAPQELDMTSPDNTSDGVLKKKWKIIEGKRMLIKGGSGDFHQEPYNEVIASYLMEILKINHVNYSLMHLRNKPYSVCENFVTKETELVTAWRIISSCPDPIGTDKFTHFTQCCYAFGITDFEVDLNKMLVVDYLLANTDRHYGNFGFIRDVNTLKYLRFAPIYDTGTALWNKEEETEDITDIMFAKPFDDHLKYITDLSWYEPIDKTQLATKMMTVLSKNPRLEEERIQKIITMVQMRIDVINALKIKFKN